MRGPHFPVYHYINQQFARESLIVYEVSMSVIVAVVSGRDGVVASDGRRSSPAVLVDGRVEKPSIVESDEFDKTFALDCGKVIGAFCGLWVSGVLWTDSRPAHCGDCRACLAGGKPVRIRRGTHHARNGEQDQPDRSNGGSSC